MREHRMKKVPYSLTYKGQKYNLWDDQEGYSGNIYDIGQATRDGVVYPSLDPSVFEVKYPDSDIKGRVTSI